MRRAAVPPVVLEVILLAVLLLYVAPLAIMFQASLSWPDVFGKLIDGSPLIIAAVGAIVVAVIADRGKRASDRAAASAEETKIALEHNTEKTEAIHGMVNGATSELKAQIVQLNNVNEMLMSLIARTSTDAAVRMDAEFKAGAPPPIPYTETREPPPSPEAQALSRTPGG